jgi:uncharacterized protein YbaR (Trm112 family)
MPFCAQNQIKPHVLRYVSGLPEYQRRARLMLMLQAWVDESGNESGDAYVLGGFVSTAVAWESFSDEWFPLLYKGKPFHMHEASRWHRSRRRERIERYIRCVERYAKYRVECSIPMPAYDSEIRGKVPKLIDNPYFFGFHNIIAGLLHGAYAQGYRQTLDIFFDEQVIFGPRAKRWYPIVRDIVPDHLRPLLPPEPIFRRDDEFLPLQAADLLAWNCRKSESGDDAEWAWLMNRLRKIAPISERHLDVEALRLLHEEYNSDLFDPATISRWERETEG